MSKYLELQRVFYIFPILFNSNYILTAHPNWSNRGILLLSYVLSLSSLAKQLTTFLKHCLTFLGTCLWFWMQKWVGVIRTLNLGSVKNAANESKRKKLELHSWMILCTGIMTAMKPKIKIPPFSGMLVIFVKFCEIF